MCHNKEEMVTLLEDALQRLASERGIKITTAVTPVVWANLDVGRIQKVIGKEPQASSYFEYVTRVANQYERWSACVQQIQIEPDRQAWGAFFITLQKWAYCLFRRKGFPTHPADRYQHAVDAATDAARVILSTRFPYDVHFESWTYVILQNICCKHIDKVWNPTDMVDKCRDSFDDRLINALHSSSIDNIQQADLRQDLFRAIGQMSAARQQFIKSYYFDHKPFSQIAIEMGRENNSLYKLHYDALKDLGQILGGDRYNHE